ncbi:MAG: iron donor protein CyaY [Acidiferrobacterales bacterium]
MNEAEFNSKVEKTLQRIEQAVEASGADIEFENAGDILTLEFTDGSKVIVNKQGAATQIWVAAKSGGYHDSFQDAGAQWVNDQSGEELFAELSRIVSQQARAPVRIA